MATVQNILVLRDPNQKLTKKKLAKENMMRDLVPDKNNAEIVSKNRNNLRIDKRLINEYES